MYFITYLQWNNVQIRDNFLFVFHENYSMRIIGPILLVIGLTLILCATAMCVYSRTVMQSTSRQNASSMQVTKFMLL